MECIPLPNTSNGTPITTDHTFMKILPAMHQGPRKLPLHFLNSSVERKPLLSTSNGASNQTITPDRMTMNILLEIYLAIGKCPLNFENHS